MSESLEQEIRTLRSQFWSERDPAGLGFAPLADAYRRAGDMDLAQELLDDGLGRHPEFSSGHVVAAWVARDRGDASAASAALQRVLDLDPENVVALRELGELAEERGDPRGALDYYRRLAELEPFDDEVRSRVDRVTGVVEGGEGGGVAPGIPDVDELELPPDPRASGTEAEEEPEDLDLDLADAAAELDSEGSWGRGEAGEFEEEGGEEGELYTATMAELYVRQGLYAQAEDVYRRLLDADPENQAFRDRLREVGEMAGGGAGEERVEAPEVEAEEEAPEVEAEEEAPEVEAEEEELEVQAEEEELEVQAEEEAPEFEAEEEASWDEPADFGESLESAEVEEAWEPEPWDHGEVGAGPEQEPEPAAAEAPEDAIPAGLAEATPSEGDGNEVEALAEEPAAGPEEAEVESPFAWGEDATEGMEAPEAPRDPDEATASDYFRELLAWSPSGVGWEEEPEAVGAMEAEPEGEDEGIAVDEPATAEVESGWVEPEEVAPAEEVASEEVAPEWVTAEEVPPAEDVAAEPAVPDEVAPEWVTSDEVPPAEDVAAETVAPLEVSPDPEPLDLEEPEPLDLEEAEPVEPVQEPAVPVESLAPDEAASEAVPVESLAPEEAASEAVPIESLAPEEIPEPEPGDVARLSAGEEEVAEDQADPDIAGVLGQIDALGSHGSTPEEEEEEEDDDMDDFQKWLDSLKS